MTPLNMCINSRFTRGNGRVFCLLAWCFRDRGLGETKRKINLLVSVGLDSWPPPPQQWIEKNFFLQLPTNYLLTNIYIYIYIYGSNLHPLTLNYLKFGTNVPLHELGKCAKLFCARLYHSNFKVGGIFFLFCFKVKATQYHRISVFFKNQRKILPYLQYFWNLVCRANIQLF